MKHYAVSVRAKREAPHALCDPASEAQALLRANDTYTLRGLLGLRPGEVYIFTLDDGEGEESLTCAVCETVRNERDVARSGRAELKTRVMIKEVADVALLRRRQ